MLDLDRIRSLRGGRRWTVDRLYAAFLREGDHRVSSRYFRGLLSGNLRRDPATGFTRQLAAALSVPMDEIVERPRRAA